MGRRKVCESEEESMRIRHQRYYERHKEELKIQRDATKDIKKIINQRYYAAHKENWKTKYNPNPSLKKPPKTEEEKKIAKQLYNKRYSDKIKAKKQMELLENAVSEVTVNENHETVTPEPII